MNHPIIVFVELADDTLLDGFVVSVIYTTLEINGNIVNVAYFNNQSRSLVIFCDCRRKMTATPRNEIILL